MNFDFVHLLIMLLPINCSFKKLFNSMSSHVKVHCNSSPELSIRRKEKFLNTNFSKAFCNISWF